MNEQNLKNLSTRSQRERKEIASKGAKACNEVKRRKKELRECLEYLLEKETKNKKGEVLTGSEAISIKLFEQAMNGNIKAFEVIRDTTGQKPSEKVIVSAVNEESIDKLQQAIKQRQENE